MRLAALVLFLGCASAIASPALAAPPIKTGPVSSQPILPKGVDLRPEIDARGLTVRDQDGRGTCTIFATSFLIEYMQPNRPPGWRASVEYLNWAANSGIGRAYDGGFFEDVGDGYAKYGEVSEAELPYQTNYDPNLKIPANLLAEGKANRRLLPSMISPWDGTYGLSRDIMTQIFKLLDQGVPVAAGFQLNDAITTAKFGGVTAWDTEPPGPNRVEHTMAIVGYQQWLGGAGGGGYFILRNSAGPNAGDHGYVYASFRFVARNVDDVMVFRAAPRIALPQTYERMRPFRKPIPYRERRFAPIDMVRQLSNRTRAVPH